MYLKIRNKVFLKAAVLWQKDNVRLISAGVCLYQIYVQLCIEQVNKPTFAASTTQMIFMKYIFFFATLLIIFSCSPKYKFNKDRVLFDASKVQLSFKSVADMNDSYFEVKENNFFEFYRQLFDSIKNTSYPGRYTKRGDTLYLKFYDKKGTALLGTKAVIKKENKEIVFFK